VWTMRCGLFMILHTLGVFRLSGRLLQVRSGRWLDGRLLAWMLSPPLAGDGIGESLAQPAR